MNRNKWKQLLMQKNTLLIVGILGLLFVVISIPSESGKSSEDSAEAEGDKSGSVSAAQDSFSDSYVQEMEQKLEAILEETEGAGNVSVMITLKSSAEDVVEKDYTENTSQSKGDTDSQTSTDTSEATVFAEETDGTQSPYVSKTLTPEIDGIIVVADGGDDAVVVEAITGAVKALFDVDMHKIKVMKRKSS